MFTRGLIRSSSSVLTAFPCVARPALHAHDLRAFLISTRKLSNMAAKKYTFAVFAPDYTDAEGLSRRLAVRAEHLANAKTQAATGLQSASHTAFSAVWFTERLWIWQGLAER